DRLPDRLDRLHRSRAAGRAACAARAGRRRRPARMGLDARGRGARGRPNRQLRARGRPLARRQAAPAAALRLPRQLDPLALVVSSRDNAKLKLVRKLATRRQRDKFGLFAAEGEDLVAAALEGGWELDFALVDAARPPDLPVRAEQVASQLLAEVSTLGHAPRVIGVFRAARPERRLPPLGLELWRIGDPGNVGTLARACDAFGAYLALSPG